jgi:hypothetical protein
VGSLANIQILTIKYFKRLVETLEIEELKKSVLGIRPILKRSLRFYPNLNDTHFYTDGTNYSYADKFGFDENIKVDCNWLRYLQRDQKLEAGFDTGNMKSLVVAQPQGDNYRLLKFFYTLPPDTFRALGDQFVQFFATHKNKELDLYYDRAANAGESMKEDAALALQTAIQERADGTRTGWRVNLISRKQANIPQGVEYEFMLKLLAGNVPGLPQLLIDAEHCKQVKSSMEKAPAKISYKKGVKQVGKEKKSEKLPSERLPLESTNPSDAVKYLLCRKVWLDISDNTRKRAVMSL